MVVYSQTYVEEKLKKELETTYILVEDLSDGCGAKFNAIIVTPKFEGVPLLQRHRMVNEILKEEMNSIHAFTQKTLTPEQWDKQKPASKGNLKCEGLCQFKTPAQ
ncbi:bolA-like protein 2 [Trichonephila clavata]|uniref:BolA-like protein 2 n=1 Tax=Trichonephila clavata TaxID=2740835 RepID=A0A8X6I218_TRICU|nr:bolA-like protein 2 [Trichonephila clavata]